MIKNRVKQNIAFGVKEYKYLTDALKNEILVLRGDLQKAGLPIHLVTDKMVLQVLPNDAIGSAEIEAEHDSLGVPKQVTKRQSILGLNEEQLIIKYCELKARFDTLRENAGRKISELSNPSIENVDKDADNEIIKKLNDEIDMKDAAITNLNKRISELNKENAELKKDNNKQSITICSLQAEKLTLESEIQASNDMNELTMNDIVDLNEKLDKARKKKKHYKTEKDKINNDVTSLSTKINELYEKVNKEEYANKVYELKIEDLTRINTDLKKNIDFLNDLQKNSKLGEHKLYEEINKLKDELKTKIDPSEREYITFNSVLLKSN
jgi:chromosome segregation ATPase